MSSRRSLFKRMASAAVAIAMAPAIQAEPVAMESIEQAPQPIIPTAPALVVAEYEGPSWNHTRALSNHTHRVSGTTATSSHQHSINYPPVGMLGYFRSEADVPAGWRLAPEHMGKVVHG